MGYGYGLWVMGYGLWVMGYGLWVMGYGLWVMGYGLWVMGYGLWVMGYGLWVMGYGLWVMGYGLWVMGYGLWVMGYGLWVKNWGNKVSESAPLPHSHTPILPYFLQSFSSNSTTFSLSRIRYPSRSLLMPSFKQVRKFELTVVNPCLKIFKTNIGILF